MKTITFLALLCPCILLANECEYDAINHIRVIEDNNEYLDVEVDYCISESSDGINILAVLERDSTRLNDRFEPTDLYAGKGTTVLGIVREFTQYDKFTSTHIRVSLFKDPKAPILSTSFPYLKNWEAIKIDQTRLYELVSFATSLIDTEERENLATAKKILDNVLAVDPNYVSAYPELARYYMKTHGFGIRSKGVLMAEQMLLTALDIDKEHANSHVLLGYVYVWEERFDEALEEFEKAESIGTENTWLYTNWGQMYQKQGNLKLATKYYKKAADQKLQNVSYDRAISDASRKLFRVYLELEKYIEARDLASQTYKKFPNYSCYQARKYLVEALYLNKYELVLAEIEGKDLGCSDIYKTIEAISNLRMWYDFTSDTGKQTNRYFIRAMGLYPDYVELLNELAKYDFSVALLKKLKLNRGLETRDAHDQTALTKAITEDNIEAVYNLADAGANLKVEVGPDKLTPLMIAVISRNEKVVGYLVNKDVGLNKKTSNGMTALDIARYFRLDKIVDILMAGKNA